jgi:hypothetical protein
MEATFCVPARLPFSDCPRHKGCESCFAIRTTAPSSLRTV